jgi:hypothetical protein
MPSHELHAEGQRGVNINVGCFYPWDDGTVLIINSCDSTSFPTVWDAVNIYVAGKP